MMIETGLILHRIGPMAGLCESGNVPSGSLKASKKIFGAKRDEVTGECRKLHNAELHILYSSPGIIRNIKSRRLRWAGHVEHMGGSRNAYTVLVGRPEGKRPLGRSRRRWEDNIKKDLNELVVRGNTGFSPRALVPLWQPNKSPFHRGCSVDQPPMTQLGQRLCRRLRWAGHVARMGEFRNAYRVLVERPEGKIPLGAPRRRWEDNIKMDLREVGYDGRDWINLAQDRDQWRAYVRAAMNSGFLKSKKRKTWAWSMTRTRERSYCTDDVTAARCVLVQATAVPLTGWSDNCVDYPLPIAGVHHSEYLSGELLDDSPAPKERPRSMSAVCAGLL
ncbi:hypothetical protein ANN_02893 [Periplaneta americana]|uniref:Uncharacterized protein n=1 Tax=Periplaneta americana TaxID=6978 RepID=A0ABQ8TZ74_PERAM|nr:hypothetical protein ANN_02893 [Periplaneta americana]